MRVYFAGTIMGDRSGLPVFQTIVAHLESLGHTVPTSHVAHADVLSEESANTPQQVYLRDIGWMLESDCLVAEVSTPSLGVGYEICYALLQGIPCLCLHRADARLSKMIAGCTEPKMHLHAYGGEAEMLARIDGFLRDVESGNE